MKHEALFVKPNKISIDDSSETRTASPEADDVQANWQRLVRRRSFLRGVGMAGAAVLPAGKLFAQDNQRLSRSDAALLRFAAPHEFVESYHRHQNNKLGVHGNHNYKH